MKLFSSLFAAALLAAPSLGAEPLLLSPSDYAPAQILPAPPADSSPEQKKELAEIKAIQAGMTDNEFAAALRDEETENVTAFAATLGPWFDLAKLPKTAALFATLRAEEKAAAKDAKNHFQRNRPWVIDASLKTCTREDAPRSSYPSGHTTVGYSAAVILAHLMPDMAGPLMARAKAYGEHRLVCGVHYRSDIVAGQVLGTVLAEELLRNAAFKTAFDAAKTEITAARR
jgi:Membrane-associated phospholipid phosphatase